MINSSDFHEDMHATLMNIIRNTHVLSTNWYTILKGLFQTLLFILAKKTIQFLRRSTYSLNHDWIPTYQFHKICAIILRDKIRCQIIT